MATQLATFDRDLATSIEPLRLLLEKNNKSEMNGLHRKSFNEAKEILVSERVIAYYRPGAARTIVKAVGEAPDLQVDTCRYAFLKICLVDDVVLCRYWLL